MPENEPYRCTETIDLEDMIKMKQEEQTVTKEPTRSKATVMWKSGRVEEFYADLNKGAEFKKSFSDKVTAYRKFPTVEGVQVEKI